MTDSGISDEELCRIEARAAAASEGPWEKAGPEATAGWGVCAVAVDRQIVVRFPGRKAKRKDADQHFVVHARADVPRLCNEIRRLQVEVERLSLVMKAAARTGAVVVDLSHAHEREVWGPVEMD